MSLILLSSPRRLRVLSVHAVSILGLVVLAVGLLGLFLAPLLVPTLGLVVSVVGLGLLLPRR